MGDANLKCVRCDLRGPASSFYWVRAMGWCCAQHPEEAHPNVLVEWFIWNYRRAPYMPPVTPGTEREQFANAKARTILRGEEE